MDFTYHTRAAYLFTHAQGEPDFAVWSAALQEGGRCARPEIPTDLCALEELTDYHLGDGKNVDLTSISTDIGIQGSNFGAVAVARSVLKNEIRV